MSRALLLLFRFVAVGGWRAFLRSGRGSPVALIGKVLVVGGLLCMLAGCVVVAWFSLTSPNVEAARSWLFPLVERGVRRAPLPAAVFLLFVASNALFVKPFKFNPSEVEFLIAGPFSRRQLVCYKLVVGLFGSVTASLLLAPMSASVFPLASTFLGALLALVFLQCSEIIASLLGEAFGLQATGFRRRALLCTTTLALTSGLLWLTLGRLLLDPAALWRQADASPALLWALAPLHGFVEVFLAKRVWPELVGWSSLCLAIDAALVAAVFVLDARNQRRDGDAVNHDRLADDEHQREAPARRSLPIFARLAGSGPVAWRQAMKVIRRPQQIGLSLAVYAFTVFALFMIVRSQTGLIYLPSFDGSRQFNPPGVRIVATMAVLLSMTIASSLSFDFRGDAGRIDVLKALPVGPTALAAGQLFVPVSIAAAMQWLALAVAAVALRGVPPGFGAAAAFVPVVSLVLMAVENLPFFWFPVRTKQDATPEPFELIGRLLLHPLLRIACHSAAGLGTLVVTAAAFFASGRDPGVALVAAWLTLAAGGLALVALLGRTFDDFDVTRDAPG